MSFIIVINNPNLNIFVYWVLDKYIYLLRQFTKCQLLCANSKVEELEVKIIYHNNEKKHTTQRLPCLK